MEGRKFNFGDYRFGFNGKEADTDGEWGGEYGDSEFRQTHYDYGFRIYNPSIGKFLSVDPLAADYPMLTPYQFASNSPIAGVDLDGLEFFFAADGRYLGNWSLGQNKDIVVVVNDSEVESFIERAREPLGLLSLAIDFEQSKLDANTIPTFAPNGVSEAMTIDHLLDLSHIIYGESAAGKENDLLAHLSLNREIEYSKLVDLTKITPISMNQETGEKIYPSASNTSLLKYVEEFGFRDYVLFGTHRPNSKSSLDAFEATLRTTGIQIDGGVQNMNYAEFFKYKSDVESLIDKIPGTTNVFKSIFDARLGNTTDPYPNYDGWRGVNGKTEPRNEIKNVQSDEK